MKYLTAVNQDYETLKELDNHSKSISEEQVLSLIFNKAWTEEQILAFSRRIDIFHSLLLNELGSYEFFAQDYNKLYATNNNDCFNVVQNFFVRMQNVLRGTIQIFFRFCRKIKCRSPYDKIKEKMKPVYLRSDLGALYTQRLLPFDNYDYVDPVVLHLCKKLLAFFGDFRKVINLCRKMIKEESNIRKSPKQCRMIFEICYQQVANENKLIIERVIGDKGYKITNPMVKKLEEGSDFESLICDFFHKMNRCEFALLVQDDHVRKSRMENLTSEEIYLWGKDKNVILWVRHIISHFDEMKPKISMDRRKGQNKLSGSAIAMLTVYLNIPLKKRNRFYAYFQSSYQGHYLLPVYSSVNTAHNGWSKNKVDITNTTDYKDFSSQAKNLF